MCLVLGRLAKAFCSEGIQWRWQVLVSYNDDISKAERVRADIFGYIGDLDVLNFIGLCFFLSVGTIGYFESLEKDGSI